MKVLFLIHNIANCGAERVLALLVNELAKRGHNVFVLTNPREVTYPLDSRITIIDAYEGIDMNATNMIGKVMRRLRLNLGQYRILRRQLKIISPDAIVSFMGLFIWPLLLFRNKYKIIISDHSAMDRDVSYMRDFERRYLPQGFYCQTVLTEADKRFLGKKRTNVEVMYDPLTFMPINEKEYNDLLPQRKDILVCGSVDRYKVKGIDNMLRSFAIVAKEHPDWNLDIAGAGSEEKQKELEDIALEQGVEKQVCFLGFRNDVAELMKSHSMLVLPSRSEGFGMVLTEAMACGCPVVSYALSGPCEIIHHDVDGLLVKNQDICDLAKSITYLIEKPAERDRLARTALSNVSRFALSNIVRKWEMLLNKN